MAVPSITEIKAILEGYCEIDDGLISDAWITNIRDNFVVKWIEGKVGFSLLAETEYVEYYDGNNSNVLILHKKPVISLTKVEYVDRVNILGEIALTSFVLLGEEGMIKALKNDFSLDINTPIFPKGEQNIRVTYRAGYTSLPTELSEAIKYFTAERILAQLAGRTGGGDLSVQGFSRSYGEIGKYTHARNDLMRMGMVCIDDYLTGVL